MRGAAIEKSICAYLNIDILSFYDRHQPQECTFGNRQDQFCNSFESLIFGWFGILPINAPFLTIGIAIALRQRHGRLISKKREEQPASNKTINSMNRGGTK